MSGRAVAVAEVKMLERGAKVQFILAGFTQEMGFRVFAFRRVGADRVLTEFSVRADLALARRYGIQMQDLPLLCRRHLEQFSGDEATRILTFSEAEMCVYATDCATARAAAALKRKPPRRPVSENIGAAWRGPQA